MRGCTVQTVKKRMQWGRVWVSESRKGVGWAAAGMAWAVPAAVKACPVCFVAEQRSLSAYLATTALLSLLPFVLFGLIAIVWRREQRLSAKGRRADQQRSA